MWWFSIYFFIAWQWKRSIRLSFCNLLENRMQQFTSSFPPKLHNTLCAFVIGLILLKFPLLSSERKNAWPNYRKISTQHIVTFIVGRNTLCAFGHPFATRKLEPTTLNVSQHAAKGRTNACNMLRPTMVRCVAMVWPGLEPLNYLKLPMKHQLFLAMPCPLSETHPQGIMVSSCIINPLTPRAFC